MRLAKSDLGTLWCFECDSHVDSALEIIVQDYEGSDDIHYMCMDCLKKAVELCEQGKETEGG